MQQATCSFNLRWYGRALASFVSATLLLHAMAPVGNAQLLKRIQKKVVEHAAQKAAEHQAQAETTVVKATDKATDSALTKSDRGLTATMEKTGAVVDTGLNRSQRAIAELFGSRTERDHLRSDLAAGRVVLRDLVFVPAGAELLPSSDESLRNLANALRAVGGTYVIEGHVDPSMDKTVSQSLSESRAAAAKVRLVSLGVADGRLFVVGLGSTRPLEGDVTHSARIEIAKLK